MDKVYRISIIGIKKIAIYREYLLISFIKSLLYLFIQYMLWYTVLTYQGRLQELQVIMIYFIINQFLASFYSNVSMDLSDEIRQGSIINRLCKPISLEKQYFFESLGSSITKISTSSILYIVLIIYFSTEWNGIRLLNMILLMMFGYILHFVLELFFGSLAFFTQSIWGIDSFKHAMMLVFSGGMFPIFLYPEWMKEIMEWLPFSYVSGKISEYYVLHTNFSKIVIVQVISTIIIYLMYKLIMKFGISRLTINGG